MSHNTPPPQAAGHYQYQHPAPSYAPSAAAYASYPQHGSGYAGQQQPQYVAYTAPDGSTQYAQASAYHQHHQYAQQGQYYMAPHGDPQAPQYAQHYHHHHHHHHHHPQLQQQQQAYSNQSTERPSHLPPAPGGRTNAPHQVSGSVPNHGFQVYIGYGSQVGLTDSAVAHYLTQFGTAPEWVTHVPTKACFFAQVTPAAFALLLNTQYYPDGFHQISHARCVIRACSTGRAVAPSARAEELSGSEYQRSCQIYVGYGGQGAIISPAAVMDYLARFGEVRWLSNNVGKSCMFGEFTTKEAAMRAVEYSNVGQHNINSSLVKINPVRRVFTVDSHHPNLIKGPGWADAAPATQGSPAPPPAAETGARNSRRPREAAPMTSGRDATATIDFDVGLHFSKPVVERLLGAYGIQVTQVEEASDSRIIATLSAESPSTLQPFLGGAKMIPFAGAEVIINVTVVDTGAFTDPYQQDQQQSRRGQPAPNPPMGQPVVVQSKKVFLGLKQSQVNVLTPDAVAMALNQRGVTVTHVNKLEHRKCMFVEFATEQEALQVLAAGAAAGGKLWIGEHEVFVQAAQSKVFSML